MVRLGSYAARWDGDFPDPFVLCEGGAYTAFGTNGAGHNVQLLTSTDLITWRGGNDALPRLPRWSQPGNTWAPSVLRRPEGYVLYYTVREPRSGRQAISAAKARAPHGPFRDRSRGPLIFQEALGGSIDASPFVDVDGRAYLYWKADANALGRTTSLWGQELSSDGTTLAGSPTRLLESGAAWEHPLIEAPSVIRHMGRYFLFYSANWWNSDRYAIGYAYGTQPLGPFSKHTTIAPWASSTPDTAGPGGQEFFFDANGALRMVYHAWTPGRVGYPIGARTLRIATVTFDEELPVLAPDEEGDGPSS